MIRLPGWDCRACRGFNGEAKERLAVCRACGAARPRGFEMRGPFMILGPAAVLTVLMVFGPPWTWPLTLGAAFVYGYVFARSQESRS